MDEWWAEINNDILGCLSGHGPITAAELGRKLGLSEGAIDCIMRPPRRPGILSRRWKEIDHVLAKADR